MEHPPVDPWPFGVSLLVLWLEGLLGIAVPSWWIVIPMIAQLFHDW
jgi:hypothetical protein